AGRSFFWLLALLHGSQDRLHERGQIVRLAARDEVAVAHDLLIDVMRPRVRHVVLDREEARRALAFQGRRRAEYPRAMTDCRDDLALLGHAADEANDR